MTPDFGLYNRIEGPRCYIDLDEDGEIAAIIIGDDVINKESHGHIFFYFLSTLESIEKCLPEQPALKDIREDEYENK